MPRVRLATVKAFSECELLILKQQDFHEVIEPLFPDLAQSIQDMGKFRVRQLELNDQVAEQIRILPQTSCHYTLGLRPESHLLNGSLLQVICQNEGACHS